MRLPKGGAMRKMGILKIVLAILSPLIFIGLVMMGVFLCLLTPRDFYDEYE